MFVGWGGFLKRLESQEEKKSMYKSIDILEKNFSLEFGKTFKKHAFLVLSYLFKIYFKEPQYFCDTGLKNTGNKFVNLFT